MNRKFRIGDRVVMRPETRQANPRARSVTGTVTHYHRRYPDHVYVRQDGYKGEDWWSEEAWELFAPEPDLASASEYVGAGC